METRQKNTTIQQFVKQEAKKKETLQVGTNAKQKINHHNDNQKQKNYVLSTIKKKVV